MVLSIVSATFTIALITMSASSLAGKEHNIHYRNPWNNDLETNGTFIYMSWLGGFSHEKVNFTHFWGNYNYISAWSIMLYQPLNKQ